MVCLNTYAIEMFDLDEFPEWAENKLAKVAI
jgi:hypothetical protein